MSVARFSCPQFPDSALRTTQQPVDVATVGVGSHLRRNPGGQAHQRLGQRPVHTEDTLESREAHLHLLADRRSPMRLFGRQQDAVLGQLCLELAAAVSQISQEPAGNLALIEAGCGQQFPHEERVRDVGRGQLVGERPAVGGAQSKCNFTP